MTTEGDNDDDLGKPDSEQEALVAKKTDEPTWPDEEDTAPGQNPDPPASGRWPTVRIRRRVSSGELIKLGAGPTSFRIRLFPIKSDMAPCFFCRKTGCDLSFFLRSKVPGRTKAYAVHRQCVFDHEELSTVPLENP